MASNGAFYSNTSGLNLNTSTTTRINISTGGVITFNNDYSFPTADGGNNEVLITDGAGNLSFSTIPNASLDNSSFTLGSTSISLGDTVSSIAGLTSITASTISATTINTSGDISVGTLGNTNDILIVGSGKTITSTDVLSINPTSKFVGINQSSPQVTLHMTGEGAQTAQIRMEQYNDSADAPDVRTRRYRGTVASPAAIQAGDYLYRSNHEYYNGTSLIVGGQFAFDNTNNANRTQFTIAVTTDGTSVEASSNDDVQFKIDGNDSGAITFNDAYKFPTTDGSANNVLLTDGNGALSFGTVPNAGLTNSSFTLGSTSISLGDTVSSIAGLTSISTTTANISGDLTVDTNTLFVDSTNNRIGVNTVNPAYQFEIENTGANALLVLDRTDGAACFIEGQATRSAFGSVGATPLALAYNSAAVVEIGASGAITVNPSGANPFTFPTSDGTSGQVLSTNGSGVVTWSNAAAGTVTSVGITAGALIDVSNSPITTSGNITVAVDLSELSTSTTNGDGDFFAVIDSSNVQRKLTKGSIDISGFNNDAGYTTNTGTVTSVAISGTDGIDVDSGSPITGSGTIQLGLSNVPNSVLSNSSFTVNAPSGTDPVVPLGGTLNFTSSDSSVTIAGNSGTDTIDLTVAAGVDTFVTGGTFTSGTLSLSLNDGTSAQDISGLWTSIPNSALANSAITIAGTSVSLGGSISGDDIISDVSAGQITNSQLVNSSLTVTAGSGLANGGSVSLGGSVTLNVGAGTGIQVNANDVALDYAGTNNFIDSATNLEGTGIATSDTIVYHDATDNNVKKGLVSDLPFSNNSGTVTSVGITAGALIDVSNSPITTSGNITVAVDLSELSTSTTNGDGDFFAVVDASNVQRKLTKGNINISGFNNDAGFTTNTGTVTSVAISGTDGIDVDSGSPITGSGTIQLGLSNVPNSSLANSSITINGTAVSLGGTISVGDITEVIAGDGLTGGGNSGSVTIDVDYAGTDNYILAAGAGTGDIQTAWHIPVSNASNNVLYYDVLALPFTNNQGTVTSVAISGTDGIDVDSGSPITGSGTIQLGLSNVPNSSLANSSVTVTGGNGLTGGGSVSLGGSVTLNVGAGTLIDVDGSNVNVDLSELTTSTANGDGDYFVVVDTANAQKKLTKGNINISGFNNDAGYITSAGNTNIYNINGTLSGARELNQNGNNLRFRGTSNEEFQVYKSNATAVQTPRVRFETDDTHTSVLELQASAPTTFLIDAYDAGNAPVFNVDGVGNLFAVSKSFLIEHPSKEGFNLRHGSLEGPEHGVYVRGKLDGSSTIELPDYWLDLVDENTITVQLTPIGSHQNLYVKDIIDNTVIVANSALLSSKIKCFYFVQAERKDIDKMVVEYPRETPTI